MDDDSSQARTWIEEPGKRYTDRNPHSVEDLEDLRTEQYGVTQTELYEAVLGGVDRDSRVLEVGTNVGVQLRCLRRMGFENLYGFDVQEYAISKCREYDPDVHAFVADATSIPVKDEQFDLVFTNGVLLTMPPNVVRDVMAEVVRCSRRYVLGQEFHADEYTRIDSDHEEQLYWKADFCDLYQDVGDLTLVESRWLEYLENDNVDRLFLLEKDGND